MKIINFNFSTINLGCVKNLVDTQYLLGKILNYSQYNDKYSINYMPDSYDDSVKYVFLNTCWFIKSWRDEMFETIDKLLKYKKKIYIVWCGVYYFQNLLKETNSEKERYLNLLSNPDVNIISWKDFDILNIDNLIKWYSSQEFQEFEFVDCDKAYVNLHHKFEYIKIAEGCNNNCTFCIIPKIRWKQKSLTIENIVFQIRNALEFWVEEFILISQDTTRYWVDIYDSPYLLELLGEIEKIEWDFKYRLLYMYPDILTIENIDKFKSLKKFISYWDIPFQHINADLLKRMWRFNDVDYIYKFLDHLKKTFPESFIRTNFIVWFPGETDEAFQDLLDFVKKWYFDNIAIFEYHDEILATSYKLPNKIDDKTIWDRFNILKSEVDKQLSIKSQNRLWKKFEWYIMDMYEISEWNWEIVVRPVLHSPEIDNYDTILFEQIKWVYSQSWEIDIWTKIIYNL